MFALLATPALARTGTMSTPEPAPPAEWTRSVELARELRSRGLFPQAIEQARQARERIDADTMPELAIAADIELGAALQQAERANEAIEVLRDARQRAQARGLRSEAARALLFLSSAFGRSGLHREALAAIAEGLALAQQARERELEARFLLNRARTYLAMGDTAAMRASVAQAVAIELPLPAPDLEQGLLLAQTSAAASVGDDEEARRAVLAAAQRAAASGNRYMLAFAEEIGAGHLCRRGQTDAGLAGFARALAIYPELEVKRDQSRATLAMATCLAGAGRMEEAWQRARESRDLLDTSHERLRTEAVAAVEALLRTEQLRAERAEARAAAALLQVDLERERLQRIWLSLAVILILLALMALRFYQRRLLAEAALATESQRVRSALFARTSHEIRNPAQGLIGVLESLRDGPAGNEERTTTALRAARLIEALSRQYLAQAQGSFDSTGRRGPEPVHLGQLLDAAIALAQGIPSPFRQTLHRDLDPRLPPWLLSEPSALLQVLLNLLTNARRYGANGAIRLHARADTDPRCLIIEVADQGPGLSATDRDHLFTSGTRGSQGMAFQGGLGLGLGISREIVERMGGGIEAHNRPEGGALFRVRLPLLPVEAPAAPVHTTTAQRSVWLIDDDELVRAGLRAQFEGLGCTVSEFEGPEFFGSDDVFGTLTMQAPELVLLDHQLGDHDGHQVLERLRAHDTACGWRRRIVMLSGSEPGTDPDARSSLLDEYLLKPLRRSAIIELLERTPTLHTTQ